MKKFNKRAIYIALFAILYVCVGLVSTIHAVSFFSLANGMTLAVMLACAFEVGQAAVLFSILTDIRKRKKVMPWLLMGVLTIVQILGNIYSSYKYLITNSEENLRYFKEPIFTWVQNMPDQNANVILCYVIGAILPVISLLMTGMLTSYLGNDAEKALEQDEDQMLEEDIDEGEPNPEEEPVEEVEPIEEGEPATEEDEDFAEPEAVIVEEDEPKVEETVEEPEVESHPINI